MPCIDDRTELDRQAQQEYYQTIDHLLCEAMDIIEQHRLMSKCSTDLKKWFKKHEQQEVERVKREALAKLSPKEIRALGLK